MASKIFMEKNPESEIIAVIMAAIAAYTKEQGKMAIIKRITSANVPLWSLTGRQEFMKK